MPCPQPERLEPCSWDRELTFQLFPSSPTEQGIFILSPAGSCRSLGIWLAWYFHIHERRPGPSAGKVSWLFVWSGSEGAGVERVWGVCWWSGAWVPLVWTCWADRTSDLWKHIFSSVSHGKLLKHTVMSHWLSAMLQRLERMMLRWACPLVLYANEQSCDVATANRLFGLFHLLQHRRVLNAAVEL